MTQMMAGQQSSLKLKVFLLCHVYISRSIYRDIGIRPYLFGHVFAITCVCIECFHLHDLIEHDWKAFPKMPGISSDLSGHISHVVRQATWVLQMQLWKRYRIAGWFGSPELLSTSTGDHHV